MNDYNKEITEMWNSYLESIDEKEETTRKEYEAWSFGDNEQLANELAELVKKGIKTATASLHYFYTLEDEALPEKGELSMILDGHGQPQCIIETTQVVVIPYNEVTEEFARKEGEGDRSLAYWRDAHYKFFTRELANVDQAFSDDMLVVCEEFKVVY